MDQTIGSNFLEFTRARLGSHLTLQIRTCLDAISDEMIWWRANEQSNAIGNLVLHCAGSTRHHIGHIVGGRSYIRNRDSEFKERRQIPKNELIRQLNQAVTEADIVLQECDPEQLLNQATRSEHPLTLMQVIGHQLIHYSNHTGQIVFATKMLKANAIEDIWRNTIIS